MLKLADSIQLSFKINDSEKKLAKEASETFLASLNQLNIAKEHLEIIRDVFQKYETIDPESVKEKIGVLNRFKKKVKENYGEIFKLEALKAIELFSVFDTDSQVEELIEAFRNSISDLEKAVVIFLNQMDEYENVEFRQNILLAIENIFKETAQISQLVKDRIINYIDDNILLDNWMSDGDNLVEKAIKQDNPEIYDILKEQEPNIPNRTKEEEPTGQPNVYKRPQSLTPADNQRMWSPTDLREIPENEDVGRHNTKGQI